MELTNPILHREFRQGLLGKRLLVIQWLFVAALASVVWLAWPRTPKLNAEQLEVSERLFSLFWAGLYFAVATLAAAMSAISITRERETGCFDLLCTTGLSTPKLVLGKFLSVIGSLLLLVVSSVPIAAACYLMGGVSWQEIGFQYLDLCAASLLYGGIGLSCSAACERNPQALSVAFVISLPLAALSVASQSAKHWIEALGLLILLVNWDKVLNLVRRPREKNLPAVGQVQTIEFTVNPHSTMDRILIPTREHRPFRDDKNAVYEREWMEESEGEGRTWWHVLLRLNVGLAAVVTVFLFFAKNQLENYCSRSGQSYDMLLSHYAELTQFALYWYIVIIALFVGPALSANLLSKERERQTADLLLTTLLTPLEILFGKWRLALRSSFHLLLLLLIPLLPLLALVCFGKGGDRAMLLKIALYGLGTVAITLVSLNTLGMFCSLISRNSAQALSMAYLVAVAWLVAPVVIYFVLISYSELPALTYSWTTHLTPFLSFYTVAGSRFFSKTIFADHPGILILEYFFLNALLDFILFSLMIFGFNRFLRKV